METVGIRELKSNLSRYLKKVRSGEKIIVTDRKKQVALILPCSRETDEEKLLQLVQGGLAQWSGGKPAGLQPRIYSKGANVSDAVLEDRR